MKNKIVMLSFILFALFIGTNNVNAASCDKYGCATCIYAISNYEVKYDVTSNGSDISVDFKNSKTGSTTATYNFTNNLEKNDFKKGDEIVCPSNIYVVYGMSGTKILAKLYSEEKDNSVKAVLSTSSTDNNKTITGGTSSNNNANNQSEDSTIGKTGCSLFSEEFIEFMQLMLNYIRIAGLVLTVVLSVMDYTKAIFSNEDNSNSKTNKRFSTRLIVLALLFLIPAVLTFILKLFNIQGVGESGTCGIY
jgi:hypothetical protein